MLKKIEFSIRTLFASYTRLTWTMDPGPPLIYWKVLSLMLTKQSAQVVELVLLAFTSCTLKIRGEELSTC